MENDETKLTRKSRATQAYPKNSLRDSLRIAISIKENNASKPFNRLTLAKSLGYSPSSSGYRMLITSSGKFGVTNGSYQADKIELTALGLSIVMPKDEQERNDALLKALLGIPFYEKFFKDFNNNKLPSKELLLNTLHRDYDIPVEDTDNCYNLLLKNSKELNLIDVASNGAQYIKLDNLSESPVSPQENIDEISEIQMDEDNLPDENDKQADLPISPNRHKPIFVAHGKDKVPLDQLKVILDEFKIPYRVAIDEPHTGRPISAKVRDLMNECGSAIVIFSSQGEAENAEKGTIANLNVVFELGAASVLYGEKVIIFKEDGLALASDFSDLGHISFERGKLETKTLDLLKELISMGFVQVLPTN